MSHTFPQEKQRTGIIIFHSSEISMELPDQGMRGTDVVVAGLLEFVLSEERLVNLKELQSLKK